MNVLDLLLEPELVRDAWRLLREEQTEDRRTARSSGAATGRPSTSTASDGEVSARDAQVLLRPVSKYDTYLEQLGIDYPTVRR